MIDISSKKIHTFIQKLHVEGRSSAEIKKSLASTTKFLSWAYKKSYINKIAFKQSQEAIDNYLIHAKLTPQVDKSFKPVQTDIRPNSLNFGIQHYIAIMLIFIFMAILGAGIYNRFFVKQSTTLAYPTTLTRGGRLLSFQGRLTDSIGNPIVTATDVQFKLYSVSTGGSSLYATGTCSTTPDQDGIFNVLIGGSGYTPTSPQSVCGTEVPATIFSENANVYMGVTIGTDSEMTPRQQIANVGYAINSETLQGYPPGTTINSIPYINNAGDLLMAASAPSLRSTYTSATFALTSANAVTIQSAGTGDISLAATGSGNLKFQTGATPTTQMIVTNAGSVGIGTTSPGQKLDVVGNATASGNITMGGQLQLGRFPVAPSALGSGSMYYDTVANQVYYYNGSAWTVIGSGSGSSFWMLAPLGGAISPTNSTFDMLVGGTATSSAKIAFTNISSGTPTIYFANQASAIDLANTTVNALNIESGLMSFDTQNSRVGIGITTPGQKLSVNGGLSASYLFDYENNSYGIDPAGTGNFGGYSEKLTGGSLLAVDSGNVGIGNATPIEKLDVTGNATLSGNLTFSNNGVIASRAKQSLTIGDSQTGDVIINPGGNVGIGTTAPSTKLDVNGTITTQTGVINSNVADSSTAVAFLLASNNTLSTQGSKLLSVKNASTEKFYIDSSGNVYAAGTILSGNGSGILMTNKSGGTVAQKALVITDSSNDSGFTTTTTPYSKAVYGVVTGVGLGVTNDADGDGACDANDNCMVAYGGEVNVTIKNTTTVVKGDYVYTSDTAGSAVTSTKMFDGVIGVVTNTSTSGSGYVKMVFKPQIQVTAAASIDKTSKHNEYRILGYGYVPVGEGTSPNGNIPPRGLYYDNYSDGTKTDSANTTVSGPYQVSNPNVSSYFQLPASPYRVGLTGGQTYATSTTDNAGNTYLGSNTVNKVFYYDRTRDSSPQVQVELGIDPNWYNGVTLSVATTSAQFSQNDTIWGNVIASGAKQSNPNLSTTYNGSLLKVTGTYTTQAASRTIFVTIKSPTTFDWTDYNGNSATGVTMTPGTAQSLSGTASGIALTFTGSIKYNTGDVFKIASWLVEPASANQRGSKAQFPERSYIVGEGAPGSNYMDIVDADTQKLWMRFTSNDTGTWASAAMINQHTSGNSGTLKSVTASNGELYVAGSYSGVYGIRFNNDSAQHYSQGSAYGNGNYQGVISQRNSNLGYDSSSAPQFTIVSNVANDVSAAVIPNQPTQNVTVSGWGYIYVNATTYATETVNLPYKFNSSPQVNISFGGLSSGVPTKLNDCSSLSVFRGTSATNISTTSFTAATFSTTASTNTEYDCYTWTATGVVSPRQYVAVATGATGADGGTTLINETDQTSANMLIGSQHANVLWQSKVFLTSKGTMYVAANDDTDGTSHLGVYYNTPTISSEGSWALSYGGGYRVGSQATAWSINGPTILGTNATNQINSLYVTEGTSAVDSKSNTIYVGTNGGLTVIQEKQSGGTSGAANQSADGSDEKSGSVKYYTKDYISEEMVGDIRGMWPLNNNTASDLEDISVKAHNFTNNGSMTIGGVSGVRGAGTDFNGSTQYLSVADHTDYDFTTKLFFSAWINPDNMTNSGPIFGKGNSNVNRSYAFYRNTNGKMVFWGSTDGNATAVSLTGNAVVPNSQWSHVAVVYDSANVYIYVNGQLDTSTAFTGSLFNSTAAFTSGYESGLLATYYDGKMDELMASATPASAGQIKHMYEVGYRALQSHATTLGGGGADLNQQLGFISTGTNTVGDARVDYNNQFMYVGTNSTTLGAVSKIDLNSDTNIKTYNSSANVPTGGSLLIDEDTKSLAVGYDLEAVGSAASGVKSMGVNGYATATSGNFVSKTVTTAESFSQAYLWAQYTLDSSDTSNTIQVWASNDGGSNYYQCNLTNTDSNQSPTEYEYFCQFNTAGSSLKTKFVMARGSTKTNTYVTRYGIAWIGSDAIAGAPGGNGLYTNNNASVANGSYIDVAHNQNSNDVLTNGWQYNTNTSKWEMIDVSSNEQATNSAQVNFNTEANYSQENMAYAVTLTPSATTGSVTLTLGSGTWNSDARVKAGCRVTGNGGVATITSTPAAQTTIVATTSTDFTNTSAIASGSWNLYCTTFDGSVAKINFAYGTFGSGADGDIAVTTAKNLNTNTIATGRSTYADGIAYKIDMTQAAGNLPYTGNTAILTVDTPSGLAAGDEILLINLQGTSGDSTDVGKYEFLRISTISTKTITFTTAIVNSYKGTTATNQKVIIQRVPQYGNVTLSSSGSLTASAWDGLATAPSGGAGYYTGIVAFRASGTVTVGNGTSITTASKGFRGGQVGGNAAEKTDGYTAAGGGSGGNGGIGNGSGTPNSSNNGANSTNNAAGGGGGGGTYDHPTCAAQSTGGTIGGASGGKCYGPYVGPDATANTGGGGGGGALGGGGGGGGGKAHTAGTNGSTSTLTTMQLGGGASNGGGGGGGGGCSNGGNNYGNAGNSNGNLGAKASVYTACLINPTDGTAGAAGNPGGGIVFVAANTISVSGTITAGGGTGGAGGSGGTGGKADYITAYGGGGGGGGGYGGLGGAGGSTYIIGNTVTLGSSLVTAGGGTGGSAGSGGSGGIGNPWAGGAGAAGPAGSTGGNGVIRVEYVTSLSGTTTPTASTQNSISSTLLSYTTPTSTNYSVVTNTDQLTTSSWDHIDSVAVTETLNSQTINYSVSFDGRTTFYIYDSTASNNGWRPIARNNSGTWQYNSNTTAGVSNVTWTSATYNSQNGALSQAVGVTQNQMTGTQLGAVTAVQWREINGFTPTTNTLDFAASLKTTSSSQIPQVDQIKVNYTQAGYKIVQQDTNTARLYNYSGTTQNLRLDVITGGLGRNSGTVSLSPSAADVDANSNMNSIWVNKTGSGGNLLKLQTSGVDKFTVDSSGNGYFSGNIGIGTSSPVAPLDVRGAASISGTLTMAGDIIPYSTGQLNVGTASNRFFQGYFANGIYTGYASTYYGDNTINFGGGSKVLDSSGKLQLKAGGTGTGSTGTASIYFLSSTGITTGRFDTSTNINRGTGSDGALSTSTSTKVDGTKTGVSTTSNAGQTTVSVSSTAGFAATNLVLVIQMTGTGAGNYEIRKVSSLGSGTLIMTENLTNTYTNDGSSKAQVIKLMQYTDVTVNSSGIITADAWNGTTGGVVIFLATGTVTVNTGGTIQANALGFSAGTGTGAGGAGGTGSAGQKGTDPCSPACTGWSAGGGGAGGIGGGGAYGAAGTAGSSGGNGGTGSYNGYGAGAGSGGGGGSAGSAGTSTYGSADLSTAFLGSGGGNGGAGGQGGNSGGGGASAAAGGAGGGIVMVLADVITTAGSGTITSTGGNGSQNTGTSGTNSIPNQAGGGGGSQGGGGSGGSVLLQGATSVTLGNVSASGGTPAAGSVAAACSTTGGTGAGGGAGTNYNGGWCNAGTQGNNPSPAGGGGVGRIACKSASCTGTASPTANTSSSLIAVPAGYGSLYLGATNTASADLAEYYVSGDKNITAGDVVSISDTKLLDASGSAVVNQGVLRKADKPYDPKLLGIISTNPGVIMGSIDGDTGQADKRMLALSGRVPVKIAPDSPTISIGDFLTSSSTYPGMAQKATQYGYTVAKALENWESGGASTIEAFVHLDLYDPDLQLNNTGDLQIVQKPASTESANATNSTASVENVASGSAEIATNSANFVYNGLDKDSLNKDSPYIVFNNAGSVINRIGVFSEAAIANFRVGFVRAEKITTKQFTSLSSFIVNLSSNSFTALDASINRLIVTEKIRSPIVETTDLVATGTATLNTIATNEIKPQSGDLVINLDQQRQSSERPSPDNKGVLARLIIKGLSGKTAAIIDAEGNASFSGTLAAQEATISGTLAATNINTQSINSQLINTESASVSGTLIATDIQSNNINQLEGNVASQSSTISNLSSNINDVQKLLADIKNNPLPNAQYYQSLDSSNVASASSLFIAQQLTVNGQSTLSDLTVSGQSNFYNVSVGGSLLVGQTMIENNSILSLASDLKLSSLGTITLFDGAVVIAKDGKIITSGELIAQGGVRTNEIRAINNGDDINIQLQKKTVFDKDSLSQRQSSLNIQNTLGDTVASIDASGSAQFNNLAINNLIIDNKYLDATQSGAIIAAADNFTQNGIFAPAIQTQAQTAGIGILPSNQQEIIIYNDRVKDNSLIYLTPTSSSAPQLNVSQKIVGEKPYFKVITETANHSNIQFNWLIIN